VDASLLAIMPSNLAMREAAALPLIFITAWEGLVDRAHVGAGDKVLVHGGAGGVGHMAVQIALRAAPSSTPPARRTARGDREGYGRHLHRLPRRQRR
jgi:NADPH2:quinone reductase